MTNSNYYFFVHSKSFSGSILIAQLLNILLMTTMVSGLISTPWITCINNHPFTTMVRPRDGLDTTTDFSPATAETILL